MCAYTCTFMHALDVSWWILQSMHNSWLSQTWHIHVSRCVYAHTCIVHLSVPVYYKLCFKVQQMVHPCMYMHVCVHVCTHTYTHMYACTYLHASIHHIYLYIYISSHQRWHTLFLSVIKKIISLYLYIHLHKYGLPRAYLNLSFCMICIYVYRYIYIYIYDVYKLAMTLSTCLGTHTYE